MKNTYILAVVLLVVGLGGGFFAGAQYQKSQTTQSPNQRFISQGRSGGQGRANNGNVIAGEIQSQDDKSITIKLADGSSKIVILSDNTTINKAASGTKSDLKTGERVAVFGTSNSDGSVTAQNVQINPIGRFGAGGSPSPTP